MMPFLTFQINPFELAPWGSADAQSPSKTNANGRPLTDWQVKPPCRVPILSGAVPESWRNGYGTAAE
ncbi:MAG: hypothetical protein ACFNUE_01940 [Bacteroides sp.]